jgi:hypothetical protein
MSKLVLTQADIFASIGLQPLALNRLTTIARVFERGGL